MDSSLQPYKALSIITLLSQFKNNPQIPFERSGNLLLYAPFGGGFSILSKLSKNWPSLQNWKNCQEIAQK